MQKALLIYILFSLFPGYSQELKPLLPHEIKNILSQAKGYTLNESNISYSLTELGTQNEVLSFDSNKLIIPASLSKILTSFYALKSLGENYRFRTTLHYSGEIKSGVLHGDLFMTGDGDPLLSNADLINFILSLKEKGIKQVKGNFYFNAEKYPAQKWISAIGLSDQTYNPGVSALSLEFNRFTIWRGGHRYKSSKSSFTPIPNIPYLQVLKVSKNFSPGLRFLNIEGENEQWNISNYLRYKIIEEVPIRKPAKYTCETLRMMAQNMGIELPESSNFVLLSAEKRKNQKKLIHEHYSRPLYLIVKATMEYSNNLLAELLLLAADHKYYKSKSLEQAATKMIKWYQQNYPKIDFSKTKFMNGSGLDTENKIKAKTLTHFLSLYSSEKIHKKHFMQYLSISGQSGWLTKRMHDPEMSYQVFAKTGSLDFVKNLAGVIFGKSNKAYAFTLSLYDSPKREKLNGENSTELNRLRESAKPWGRDLRPIMDKIMTHFHRVL